MKLCKDCKWCQPCVRKANWFRQTVDYSYSKCGHESALEGRVKYDLVTGEEAHPHRLYCKTNRGFDCGEQAVFFEPKAGESE